MAEALMRVAGESRKPLPRRFSFTVASLNAVKVPAGKERVWVYDLKTPGLAMQMMASGAQTFYLYKKYGGRPRKINIGNFPEISIDNARKLAMGLNWQIAQGLDPAAMKRQERQAMTLGALWTWYLDNHAKPRKRSWKSDEDRYKKYLAPWAGRKLASIGREEISKLHSRIGVEHPTGANRVLALLSVMFSKARMVGYAGENPTKGVERFREKSRDRFMQADELPKFFAALEADETLPTWRDFFKLALLTGARRANVAGMRWADINLKRGEWKISDDDFKTGSGMTVHLSREAVKILKALAGNDSDYVFPGAGKSGHIIEPRKAWLDLLKRAKLNNLRIHDLRRTLGSWQAATGASLPVIGKSLGHKHQSTTQIYARLNLNPVKTSVNAATKAMMATMKVKRKKKVK